MKTFFSALLALLFAASVVSAEVPEYTAKRATMKIVPDGSLTEADWSSATTFGNFAFPWGYVDSAEQTTAKMLWDDTFLYVAVTCTDKYLRTQTYNTAGNYADSQEDYVQMLWNPQPAGGNGYNIFEFNCVGCPHARYNDLVRDPMLRECRILPPHITQTVTGSVNNDTGTDTGWTLEIAIRFSDYPELFSGTAPQAGDAWRVALNRASSGGGRSVQYSQWSPAPSTRTPGDFLQPEDFGRIVFSSTPVR